jgi:enamine deaminase RidA (YjgF/YER057c/UK114 family)
MKKVLLSLLVPMLLATACSSEKTETTGQKPPVAINDGVDAEANLKKLGITLIMPNAPTANYLKAKRSGNLVYLAGHGPDRPEGGQVIGRLGEDLELEAGYEAARFTGISLLSSLKAEIGDLNKVKSIVRAQGMVNATPEFKNHSQVINGFSDLMVEVFGEKGKHARAAIGMSSLPNNIAVEIDMIVEVED